ncbi:GlxA family transcriptional regulator [Amycolatopsis pigmentata]|uniref:GlxA family transcriptional regulator n=1 Tax=Amycolatopsis pigmentata TaxID=450801 RepID=A0ABW5G540_9PSEU
MTTHRVGALVFDGMTLLDVAGPVQVFTEADQGRRRYEISMVGAGGEDVRTSSGVRLAVDEIAGGHGYDTLLVPGTDGPPVADPVLVATVRRLARVSGRVASICTGSFLLAEAGLLDNRAATTHWRYADLLRRGYPAVTVEPDAIFVRAGTVFTSAGVTAGIDLALALVEDDHGPQLARDVARSLVVFMQRPGGQSQFSTRLALPAVRTGPLRTVLDAVTGDPAAEHTVDSLARRAGVSTRHLARLFRQELGLPPSRFVEMTRIELAQRLLVTGVAVTSAAQASGFGSDETLRRAFLRHVGLTPAAYRARFSTTR